MKGLVRRVARAALGWRSFLPARKRAIFAFHDVSPSSAPQHSPHYSTEPDTFARQLDFLQELFELVSLDRIVGPGPPGPRPLAALTFDDGFLSVGERVQPLLQARDVPFTLFAAGRAVREGRLDYLASFALPVPGPGQRFFLNATELIALHRAGVPIGSHGATHRPLADCSDDDLGPEIFGNKGFLEELIGAPVPHFGLPYGKKEHYDERSLARCRAAGHTHVFGTNPTLFESSDLGGFVNRPVPRIDLTGASRDQILFLLNRTLLRRIDI
jgi:peptidoglycan/xylan/chitin deacetylase (PgdA/CDA1 family)